MPDVFFGLLRRLDGGVCHSRQGKESYTQEGTERGTNDPKYELWHQETTCLQCFMGIGEELSPTVIMSPQTANHDTRTCYLERINNISR